MLESLGKVTAIPPDPQLANALAVVDDLTTRVRELALGLRPSILDDAGLAPALLWHVERYSRQTGIAVTLGYQGLDERLPAPIETAVYRIVQEALTNVARHAETPQVNVQILADGLVTVLIEDAGKGFDVEAVLARHASTGVSGMRERVELLGGEFLIESQPGGGTRVLVEIPLDAVQ
jgi:signal transduction histidine kinase